MALEIFEWENGTLVEPAKVEVGGQSYDVTDAQYEGATPLSAGNLNLMQNTLLSNVVDNLSDDTKIPNVKAVKNTYSSTEKVVGTWINGKPIYRKVVSGTTPNTTGRYNVNAGISNVGEVIHLYGYINWSGRYIALPYSENNYGIAIDYIDPNIRIDFSFRTGTSPFSIVIEYTKSTD